MSKLIQYLDPERWITRHLRVPTEGDLVECINVEGNPHLTLGEVYKVTADSPNVDYTSIWIDEKQPAYFYTFRFKIVGEAQLEFDFMKDE